jgi:hypothetical protein
MVFEVVAVAALAIGVYEYFSNASFKAKVTADFTALQAKVPSFVSTVKADVSAVVADIKKL